MWIPCFCWRIFCMCASESLVQSCHPLIIFRGTDAREGFHSHEISLQSRVSHVCTFLQISQPKHVKVSLTLVFHQHRKLSHSLHLLKRISLQSVFVSLHMFGVRHVESSKRIMAAPLSCLFSVQCLWQKHIKPVFCPVFSLHRF